MIPNYFFDDGHPPPPQQPRGVCGTGARPRAINIPRPTRKSAKKAPATIFLERPVFTFPFLFALPFLFMCGLRSSNTIHVVIPSGSESRSSCCRYFFAGGHAPPPQHPPPDESLVNAASSSFFLIGPVQFETNDPGGANNAVDILVVGAIWSIDRHFCSAGSAGSNVMMVVLL